MARAEESGDGELFDDPERLLLLVLVSEDAATRVETSGLLAGVAEFVNVSVGFYDEVSVFEAVQQHGAVIVVALSVCVPVNFVHVMRVDGTV